MKAYRVSNKVFQMFFLRKEDAEAIAGETATTMMDIDEIDIIGEIVVNESDGPSHHTRFSYYDRIERRKQKEKDAQ